MTGAADVELLPCPFCGGQPHMQSDSDVDGCYWSKVRCGSCGAATRGKWASSSANTCPQWYAEVREEWNRRACVAHATAAKDAEIEALRAEVGLLRHGNVAYSQQVADLIGRAGLAEARAERLAEALRWYAEQAAGCRKLGRDGDAARAALDADGGGRARAALHPTAAKENDDA